MRAKQERVFIATVIVGMMLCSCNLPKPTATPDLSATIVQGTLSALQTSAAAAQTRQSALNTSTPAPAATLPLVTQRPAGNPVVTTDSLCWVGPGNQYEVVSAIRAGTSVELLGRGTVAGWYIVRNPIYRDPCWILASSLQIDPSIDISGLPYFSPPATPSPTPTNTPTNTPTPTLTPVTTP